MTIASSNFRELSLKDVTRDFGAVTALRGLNLTIKRGEFIALLGPSGCGKSTALNCIAGLLPLSSGSVWLDGTRVDTLKPEQRGFGMVFQSYALFPHLTVKKNVAFGLKMRGEGREEIEGKVEEALALVRLSAHADKLPGQLSGGQQQRVAIARAVVMAPPVVLMDEPLSNLDAKLRLEMRAEIRRIHKLLGSATIYVTHDQDEALSLADRIVVMRDGQVRQIGTPEELYERPAHSDVAEFMGFRNIIPGEVTTVSGGFATGNGAALTGTPVGGLNPGPGVVAIRPEDLSPREDGPLRATVEAAEYRGRSFFGSARTQDNFEVFFSSEQPVATGDRLSLGAQADRVLVYSGAAA
jgi:putative spermidine/putrescine transport system ATP-binding protein